MLDAAELYTLKWCILCYVNFTSTKKEKEMRKKLDRGHTAKCFRWITLGDGDWVITRAWTLGVWSRHAESMAHPDLWNWHLRLARAPGGWRAHHAV